MPVTSDLHALHQHFSWKVDFDKRWSSGFGNASSESGI
jgi:hypothetical protein